MDYHIGLTCLRNLMHSSATVNAIASPSILQCSVPEIQRWFTVVRNKKPAETGKAAMTKKMPRRTAERILETTQELFNRFGEPNVSTTAISAEMRISPGNLYYHYPSKEALINALFARFEGALENLLASCDGLRTLGDAQAFLRSLLELVWQYRFLYRDMNDLMSRNRQLELHIQSLQARKVRAVMYLLNGMRRNGTLRLQEADVPRLATSLVMLATYWFSFEYVNNPRHALESESECSSITRGAEQLLSLLSPYLTKEEHQQQDKPADTRNAANAANAVTA